MSDGAEYFAETTSNWPPWKYSAATNAPGIGADRARRWRPVSDDRELSVSCLAAAADFERIARRRARADPEASANEQRERGDTATSTKIRGHGNLRRLGWPRFYHCRGRASNPISWSGQSTTAGRPDCHLDAPGAQPPIEATFGRSLWSKDHYQASLGNQPMTTGPAKTTNALLHGALDALILKTLMRGATTAMPSRATSRTRPATRSSSKTARSIPRSIASSGRGWVEAEWGTSELGRRAKLYRITETGREQLAAENGGVEEVRGRRLEGAVRVMKRSLRSWLWRVPLDQEIDEELALHLELRSASWSSAAWIRRPRASWRHQRMGDVDARQTHVGGPRQKTRSGDANHAVARRAPRRREVCVPAVAQRAGVHAGRGHHAGARHRRQQRDLRARRRDAAATAALRRSRSARHDLRNDRHATPRASRRRSTCRTGTRAAARSS